MRASIYNIPVCNVHLPGKWLPEDKVIRELYPKIRFLAKTLTSTSHHINISRIKFDNATIQGSETSYKRSRHLTCRLSTCITYNWLPPALIRQFRTSPPIAGCKTGSSKGQCWSRIHAKLFPVICCTTSSPVQDRGDLNQVHPMFARRRQYNVGPSSHRIPSFFRSSYPIQHSDW